MCCNKNITVKYFYRAVFLTTSFNYIKNIIEPWYQQNRHACCQYCEQHDKFYNSMCKECYEYSYQLTGLYKLFLLSHCIEKDLYINILYHYFLELNFNLIDIKIIYTILNPQKEIVEQIHFEEKLIEKDLIEEDLITENNVDFYLEDIQQDDDLGYWDDDSL